MSPVLFLLGVCLGCIGEGHTAGGGRDRRLLLSDPHAIQLQLEELQRRIQVLEVRTTPTQSRAGKSRADISNVRPLADQEMAGSSPPPLPLHFVIIILNYWGKSREVIDGFTARKNIQLM